MWKEYFYFNKSERRAVLLITILVTLTAALSVILPISRTTRKTVCSQETIEALHAYSLALQSDTFPHRKSSFPSQTSVTVSPHPFNPNTASEKTLAEVGIPVWMVRNILKYRAKGGHFKHPEDLKKLYGITEALYGQLRPWIDLPEKTSSAIAPKQPVEFPQETSAEEQHTPSYNYKQKPAESVQKYPEGTQIDLNLADTAMLKRIPGIGSIIARRIVNYRKKLGGYSSPSQLTEIQPDYAAFLTWFRTDSAHIRKLNLNRTRAKQLLKHPYLNYYQVRVIEEHRKRHGDLQSIRELEMYEEFSADDLKRLEPYISF